MEAVGQLRGLSSALEGRCDNSCALFPDAVCCVMLWDMGSKDKGRKEAKKAPKPKPKPEPGRKREIFTRLRRSKAIRRLLTRLATL